MRNSYVIKLLRINKYKNLKQKVDFRKYLINLIQLRIDVVLKIL